MNNEMNNVKKYIRGKEEVKIKNYALKKRIIISCRHVIWTNDKR